MSRPGHPGYAGTTCLRSPNRRSAVFAALCLFVLGGLVGSAGSAQAALIHSFDSYTGGGSLSSPEALAVDQSTGDLYVLEHGNGCVSRFFGERGGAEALEPHVFPATATNKVCGFEFRADPSNAQVAIDNSGTGTQGYFYVNSPMRDGGYGVTLGFDDEGNQITELIPKSSDFGLIYVCGVGVDADGNVYAVEHYAGIQRYNHNDPVTDADYDSGIGEGPACSVAYDSQGRRYSSWNSNGPLIHNGTVLRDNSYALTVDRSSDDAYVSEGPVVTGISSDGIQFDQFGSGQIAEGRGVAIDETNGVAYVADPVNGRIAIFQGSPAYRVGVELGGSGLGAVSADAAPLEDCGDEGQCVGYYAPSTVVLEATPQPHSKVDGWTGCDEVNPAGDECTIEVTSGDREVTTTFTRLKQQVTASTAGSGSGFISSADPLGAIQSCGDGGTCSGPYDEGSAVELTATPTGHSTFTGWSGACSNQIGPCEVVVEGSPTVTAHFTAQHPVSVKKTGTGAGSVVSEPNGLDCGGVCVGFFTDGQTVSLSAISSGNSTFVGWSGEGCSGTGTCVVEAGGATKNVTATFAHDPPSAVTGAGATFIGQRVATVSGTVNPNGANVTSCVIEYGAGAGYGSQSPCAPSAVGGGTAPVPIGVNLAGLLPGTTYHYRLSATSSGGTSLGADQTFRTLDDTCDSNEALCPPVTPIHRAETKSCRKGFVLKRGSCVKKKHRRKARRHHRGGGQR